MKQRRNITEKALASPAYIASNMYYNLFYGFPSAVPSPGLISHEVLVRGRANELITLMGAGRRAEVG